MITRVTGGWLPLSEDQLAQLGWPEGQMVELEVAEGMLIASPSQAPQPVPKPLPKRERPITALWSDTRR